MTRTRKHHSASLKAQVVREILREDRTIAQIASQFGLHPNQISQWKAAALNRLPTLFESGTGDRASHP